MMKDATPQAEFPEMRQLPLFRLTFAELSEALGGPGRARAVFRMLQAGEDPFQALEPGPRARLWAATRPTQLAEMAHRDLEDGVTKLCFRLADGLAVESVIIQEARYVTACLSTQVGCARGCRFCVTGSLGLLRNLKTEEMLFQVFRARRVAKALGLSLRNLVFMGMGEPLDNLSELRRTLAILTDHRALGFGPRHLTVSTVGPSPKQIQSLSSLNCRIAWSLHAADDRLRRELVQSQSHSVQALRDAFAEALAGRSLFVEICLIDGVNDDEAALSAILQLFDGFVGELRFNLLPVNPGQGFRPSPPHRVAAFKAGLRAAGYFASTRALRGASQEAACGQLAARL